MNKFTVGIDDLLEKGKFSKIRDVVLPSVAQDNQDQDVWQEDVKFKAETNGVCFDITFLSTYKALNSGDSGSAIVVHFSVLDKNPPPYCSRLGLRTEVIALCVDGHPRYNELNMFMPVSEVDRITKLIEQNEIDKPLPTLNLSDDDIHLQFGQDTIVKFSEYLSNALFDPCLPKKLKSQINKNVTENVQYSQDQLSRFEKTLETLRTSREPFSQNFFNIAKNFSRSSSNIVTLN